jgi:TPR repeat protein
MTLLEKAAGQGHAYAMDALRGVHDERKEYEQAMKWATNGADTGMPKAMYNLGVLFDSGQGVAAPDYLAAADWYRRAANAGHGAAAVNLSVMYFVGRGWA